MSSKILANSVIATWLAPPEYAEMRLRSAFVNAVIRATTKRPSVCASVSVGRCGLDGRGGDKLIGEGGDQTGSLRFIDGMVRAGSEATGRALELSNEQKARSLQPPAALLLDNPEEPTLLVVIAIAWVDKLPRLAHTLPLLPSATRSPSPVNGGASVLEQANGLLQLQHCQSRPRFELCRKGSHPTNRTEAEGSGRRLKALMVALVVDISVEDACPVREGHFTELTRALCGEVVPRPPRPPHYRVSREDGQTAVVRMGEHGVEPEPAIYHSSSG
ncbi:hypothetical protein V495_00229 [Pseudogymnoascus sp. VKM F-4514 (FW-929)]|nr:hypothetical protein V495_00229 [Pseudogymnoascus sp. VKM F-4514 (FW-929)]KFY67268.1 hypothetical protein V497_00470 [Pseudogymnoascus sp. VKM F-4516 (FW-969)]